MEGTVNIAHLNDSQLETAIHDAIQVHETHSMAMRIAEGNINTAGVDPDPEWLAELRAVRYLSTPLAAEAGARLAELRAEAARRAPVDVPGGRRGILAGGSRPEVVWTSFTSSSGKFTMTAMCSGCRNTATSVDLVGALNQLARIDPCIGPRTCDCDCDSLRGCGFDSPMTHSAHPITQ